MEVLIDDEKKLQDFINYVKSKREEDVNFVKFAKKQDFC